MAGMITNIFQRMTNRTRSIHSGNRKYAYKQHGSYAQTWIYEKEDNYFLLLQKAELESVCKQNSLIPS